MALLDYFSLGGVEIANHVRLAAYAESESVGTSLDSFFPCVCPTLTAEMLGDLPYVDPATDEAPWYDSAVPASEDFAGLLVLSMDGLDDHPVRRAVTNSIAGGGVLGPARAGPLTIVVTAVLLGRTCCGVEYGRHWLSEALQGCAGNACEGDCMTVFTCCPDEELDQECFNDGHRRTLRRVALVDGPRVIGRAGSGCSAGECSAGADVITVEFTLVAGVPWLWTDQVPIFELAPPADDSDTCVTWCFPEGPGGPTDCLDLVETCPSGSLSVPAGTGACALAWPVRDESVPCDAPCRHAVCEDPTAACSDPLCQAPTPPSVAELKTCYCLPLAVERQCCELDLSECPAWSVDTPVITVRAGSHELRNLTIRLFERTPAHGTMTCEEIADADRCSPLAVYHVAHVPADGAVTIDGQTGRATVECAGVCETSSDVYGRDGGPLTFPVMACSSYILCLESDVENPPAADAVVRMSVSGRGF
ncbi:hypothetical protein GCM10010387_15400 [Streptomyces inusitatus]|uniref:Uncharacterized protein n=1 Tax=Streptomyces inusitatus TaxID=68221 RepID=A0A918PVF0_9ACTN|nr:hypothetical protein [Streptomyces inusitatus]GGZ23212.1 hypothetical protein GCM10010387_15400 [Streptomyces inusitatus]